MSQPELVKKVARVLTAAGIEFMATGSVVSSLQGEPRATHDVDLVVQLRPADIPKLLAAFQPPEYYLSEEAIRDALRRKSMFNLLAVPNNDKVDFWLLTDDPFDRSRFTRKYPEDFEDIWLPVSSSEDTILAKLRWAKLSGGSEKQFTDALRVYEVQAGKLDLSYLRHWVARLGVEELWERIQRDARSL
jgi:hypothetical protein